MAALGYEGIAIDELMSMSNADFDALVLNDREIVFNLGSSEILGRFGIVSETLRVEVAHIDGGGEGVLRAFATACRKVASQRHLTQIDWVVHAATCAAPNQRLQRVLEARGFAVEDVPNVGPAYRRIESVR